MYEKMKGSPTILFLVIISAHFVSSLWYIPGVAPRRYLPNEPVDLKVDKLTSEHTQLPYGYYTLGFPQPKGGTNPDAENLGEMLTGELKQPSDYILLMGSDDSCQLLGVKNLTKAEIAEFRLRIQEDYKANWIVDNLPCATPKTVVSGVGDKKVEYYESGFLIGRKEGPNVLALNNHVDITIKYHEETKTGGNYIVAFEVKPTTIKYRNFTREGAEKQCKEEASPPGLEPLILPENTEFLQVAFTYSVSWVKSPTPWASRWDIYLKMTDNQIHWFAIINSIIVVLFLSIMVAMILARALHKDFLNLQMQDSSDDAVEEFGWKMVHGDVFRPPSNPTLLAVSVGTGVQYFGITVVVMSFALAGLLSPSNRGVLVEAFLYSLVFMSSLCGYFSARNYKLYNGSNWKKLVLFATLLYPGLLGSIFIFLNIVLWEEGASSEIKILTLMEMGFYFALTIPLSLAGTFFGYKKPKTEIPLKVVPIPRQIPEQEWYLKPAASILIGGILPFGAIFIELFFIMSSIWLHQFYYLFGFLFIVLIFLVVTCAEISIVMCYFQLCSEDYHWWWRSFLTSGAPAIYMFLYSVFYYFSRLSVIGFASGLLYFGYTFMMCTFFFLLTGSIGYYACLWFVRTIYENKFD